MNTETIQDKFLNEARKEKKVLTIYLVNGFQLKGKITSFDKFAIVIQGMDNKQSMIYKHAISTIQP